MDLIYGRVAQLDRSNPPQDASWHDSRSDLGVLAVGAGHPAGEG